MKVEDEKALLIKKLSCKLIVKKEKIDFLKTVKKLQNKQHKNLSVYVIAAKISRGERVSYEELKYIRQYSPALLSEAERHNEERKEDERSEKDILRVIQVLRKD